MGGGERHSPWQPGEVDERARNKTYSLNILPNGLFTPGSLPS